MFLTQHTRSPYVHLQALNQYKDERKSHKQTKEGI